MSRAGGVIWKYEGVINGWECHTRRRYHRRLARRVREINDWLDRNGPGFKVVASQRRRRS